MFLNLLFIFLVSLLAINVADNGHPLFGLVAILLGAGYAVLRAYIHTQD